MINKFKNIIFCLIVFIYSQSISYTYANENFNFDVKELEIKNNGNKFIGKNKGVVKSQDGTTIEADYFEYDKVKNILISLGKVKVSDPKNNIIIYSNKITYFKNKELIITDGNSKAEDPEIQITANKFEYNKSENIILAKGKVKIVNKKENYLIQSKIATYFKNKELIITDGNSKAEDPEIQITANKFEYNKSENIILAKGKVKIVNKKENYLIFSENINYNRNNKKIFSKNNSRAISAGIKIKADDFIYDHKNNILEAKGKVKLLDEINDYILESNQINYNRDTEKVFTIGNTKALLNSKYEFNSKNIFLDRKLSEFKSDNFSTIKDDNLNYYKLSKFLYNYQKKLLKGKNIEVETNHLNKDSDKFFFESAFINFSNNSYNSKNARINLNKNVFDREREINENQKNIFQGRNDPRIYGSSSSGNDREIILNNAIFTSCEKNDTCPPWSIKANKITHDKLTKNIIYKDAVLKLYDLPVFYFPKFFHPDPSVKRRSGLLQPRLNNSNVLGSSINIPYFHVLSEEKDITFKPTIFDNEIYMFQNEYRQKNKDSSFIADFSYIKGYQSKNTNGGDNNRNSISHLFSKFDLDLGFKEFKTSKLKIFLEKVNNDTYLKIFENVLLVDKDKFENDLKDKNNLTSGLEIVLDKENLDFATGFTVYENLQKTNNDRYQHVFPYYNFNTHLFSNQKGKLDFKSDGRNTLQNTNNLRTTITNTMEYKTSDILAKNGFVNNFGIYFKNLNSTGKNDDKYKSNIQSELLNIYEFNSRFPMFKENKEIINYITPKVSFRLNPSDMKNYKDESRLITTDNIFDINRIGINDSYESGKSLTLGIDFKRESKNDLGKFLEIKLAGVLREASENKIPSSSSLNKTASNLFGSIENNFSEYFSLNYDFAIDNDFNKFEYNAIEAEFNINNFVTTFNFLEKEGETGDANTIENTTKLNIDDNNTLLFKTRRNRKISLTEYYDLVYEYQNDCLTAGIKYRKTYYQDRDLKPNEDLFFTITLFPLTSLDQKIDD